MLHFHEPMCIWERYEMHLTVYVIDTHRALKYMMTNLKWLVAWSCKHTEA